MGYLFLSLALLGGLVKGFAGKGISRDVHTLADGFGVNTIRCSFCALIAFALAVGFAGFGGFALTGTGFLISGLSAVFMSMFTVAWLYAYKSEAYIFLSIFTMLGSIVTAMLGFIIYGDPLKPTRIIGMLLLFVAVYVMSLYNKNIKGKMTTKGVITLVIGGLGAALADFMQKVFTKESLGSPYVFNFYTYALAIVPQLIILYLLLRGKPKGERISEGLLDKRHILIFFVISAALYLNSTTKTLATSYIPATQMYPTLQGANLIASAILASVLFGEKITKKSIIGIAIALTSVILMNA